MEPVLNSSSTSMVLGQEETRPRWRSGWKARLVAAVLLAAVILVLLACVFGFPSHRAASYGVTDPSSAVLRIENKTTDFAIARVLVGESASGVINQKVHPEIGPGQGATIELEAGDYMVTIHWVEIGQVEAFVPKGDLTERVDLSTGEAAVLHLHGGRWSSDSLLCIPPKLKVK